MRHLFRPNIIRRGHSLFAAFLLALTCCVGSTSFAQNDSGFKFLTVKVVDPAGKPMADVPVDIRIDGAEFPLPTDEEGIVEFNVPTANKTRLQLKVSHPGYATLAARWDSGKPIPDDFTIRMQKGSVIGGIIQNEQGEPIEGVKIRGYISSQGDLGTGNGKLEPLLSGIIATTDSAGRWRCESAPAKRVEILTDFKHPDYVDENILGYRAGNWEQLHTLEHVVVLQKGVVLRGQVLDPDGEPVVGATVTLGENRYSSSEEKTTTDEQGQYKFTQVKPSSVNVTVLSSEWAPATEKVLAKPDMPPVDFQLPAGQAVTLRFVDQDGEPIKGVKVTPDEWLNLEILPRSNVTSDADGLWRWEQAPPEKIHYRLYKEGYMSTSAVDVVPRDEPYDVTIPPELTFFGTVTDAATGEPLDEFLVVEGIYWRETDDDVVWQQHRKETGTDGKYRVAYDSGYAGFKIKIEADGYRPQTSRLVAVDEGEVNIDFALETGAGPSGLVKLPAGQPAAGVDVLMADDSRSRITISNGEYVQRSGAIVATTDSGGKFRLPIPRDKFSIVCLHEAGWASQLELAADTTELTFTLNPWASLTGKMLEGSEPVEHGQISLWYPELEKAMRTSRVQWTNYVSTAADGTFAIARLCAGDAVVQRNMSFAPQLGRRLGSFATHSQACTLIAGETTEVQIGGSGVAVTGRLTTPDDFDGDISWQMGRVNLSRQTGQDGTRQHYVANLNDDGSFKIPDVPAGDYQLYATVYNPVQERDYNWKELGRLQTTVTVEETTDKPTCDVGEHVLTIKSDEPSLTRP